MLQRKWRLLPDERSSVSLLKSKLAFTKFLRLTDFIADVVESAAKSLVFIEIQDTRRMDYKTGRPLTVSNGSGFIVDSNGLILTNAHVVINKPRSVISVQLSDGRTFMGIVEAVDPISDLATVRIQCKKLPALKLGNSSELRSGEFVVALGSPLCK